MTRHVWINKITDYKYNRKFVTSANCQNCGVSMLYFSGYGMKGKVYRDKNGIELSNTLHGGKTPSCPPMPNFQDT